MVIDYLEIVDRIMTGEKIEEREYDMRIFRKTSELVKEMGLKCYSEVPVPSDDALADEVFDSALHLATEVGGWCVDTKRVIKFTEEELKQTLRELPKEITLGAGRDARKLKARKIEEKTLPFFFGGIAAPLTEELAVNIVNAIALLPIDGIFGFNLFNIRGKRITGMPLEVWANRRIVEYVRAGIRRAGKPGLHIINYPTSAKCATLLGVLGPEHIRKTDALQSSPLPELFKVDYEILTAAAMAKDFGIPTLADVCSYAGGWSGGYEGAAIVAIAGTILSQAILNTDYVMCHCLQLQNPDLWAIPERAWASNLILQAVARNTDLKLLAVAQASGEPCTEQFLTEIAYIQIGSVVCGASATYSCRPVRPLRPNLVTPMEIGWGIDLSRGALKMTREEANDFVKRIEVPRKNLENPPKGKSFEECYDTKTLKPDEKYIQIYQTVRKKFEDLGFPFE